LPHCSSNDGTNSGARENVGANAVADANWVDDSSPAEGSHAAGPRRRYNRVMAKTILVCGYGPGISSAVARRFGREKYAVALVGRTAERLAAGVAALEKVGVVAKAFPCDLSDPDAVRKLVAGARATLGPIAILHWNAYGHGAGDLTTAKTSELRGVLDVGVHGLVAAVQESLPDLKREKGSVLVTGGGFAYYDSAIDAAAVQYGAMGLAVAKAAQHKLVGLLHHKLRGEGVYVGEVTVLGMVKGTAFDSGQATLEPDAIAEKFWDIQTRREDVWVKFA
jgi:NADP-dependent 3-hydroxy acid dehydrogenase YdfG